MRSCSGAAPMWLVAQFPASLGWLDQRELAFWPFLVMVQD